jgi:transcription initiation factor IIE alpha subunit
MSKIAELLKLAEKKKDSQKIENPTSIINTKDSVSRSNEEQIRASKSNEEEARQVKEDKIQSIVKAKMVETSPNRDFTKVSNSIMKRAIPEKYFRGLSKHTYDVLYQRTRGAIVPTRTIQLTKDELVRLTGISKDAIKLHIKYLKETGLLKSRPAIGSHAGWEYEIFVPEEIEEIEQVGVRQGKARQGKASENLLLHSVQNLPLLTHSNAIENKGTYSDAKTFLKTNKNDDDNALAIFTEKLEEASRKLTGKGISPNETEKWGKLAELLILELELAARNTKNISSIPAFLTEVLRRRLILSPEEKKTSRSNKTEQNKQTPAEVGKNYDDVESAYNPDTGEYDIKPLSQTGKLKALELVYEANSEGGEFLEDLKKWYLPEDWEWLTKQLESRIKRE